MKIKFLGTGLNPRQAYLIHMSHHFGLHALMGIQMPENVTIAYDGLEISTFNVID